MTVKPQTLFLISIPLTWMFGFLPFVKSYKILLHDSYFVFGHFQFAIIYTLPTTFIAVLYYIFEFIKRPIERNFGLSHFYLYFGALHLILLMGMTNNIDKIKASSQISTLLTMIGIILFIVGAIIFLIGATRAFILKRY